MKATIGIITVFLAGIFLAGSTYAMRPVTVSPGIDSGAAVITQSCPAFSWSEWTEAVAYEVEVFEVQTVDAPSYDDMVIMAEPVLSVRIPAPALSWTPSADNCLISDNAYVWYVRGTDINGEGVWSGGRIFEVDVTAGFERFEKEIEKTVEDYLVKENIRGGYAGAGTEATNQNGDEEIVQTEKRAGNFLNSPYARFEGSESLSNTFYGDGAGANNSGSGNTFIGRNAGNSNNNNDNTFVGHNAGLNNTGSGNVFLGYFAGGLNTNVSDKLYIDNQGGSNPLIYGEFDTESVTINGDFNVSGVFYSLSDARVKDTIEPIESSLDTIASIQGVSYRWRNEEFEGRDVSETRHYGVIAQEIEKILPEIVQESSDGRKRVAYIELIPILIEAVKEQQKAIEHQQEEINELRTRIQNVLSSHVLTGHLQ